MKTTTTFIIGLTGLSLVIAGSRGAEPQSRLAKGHATLTGHKQFVQAVAFSPDGKMLASGSDDGDIRLWDVATAKNTTILTGHKEDVKSVVYSPDGKTLASAGLDAIKLWDVTTGKVTKSFRGGKFVAFSPNGKQLAFRDYDDCKIINLWDVAMEKKIGSLKGTTIPIESIAFSPDGKTLISGEFKEKSIRLWDVAARQENHLAGRAHRVSLCGRLQSRR